MLLCAVTTLIVATIAGRALREDGTITALPAPADLAALSAATHAPALKVLAQPRAPDIVDQGPVDFPGIAPQAATRIQPPQRIAATSRDGPAELDVSEGGEPRRAPRLAALKPPAIRTGDIALAERSAASLAPPRIALAAAPAPWRGADRAPRDAEPPPPAGTARAIALLDALELLDVAPTGVAPDGPVIVGLSHALGPRRARDADLAPVVMASLAPPDIIRAPEAALTAPAIGQDDLRAALATLAAEPLSELDGEVRLRSQLAEGDAPARLATIQPPPTPLIELAAASDAGSADGAAAEETPAKAQAPRNPRVVIYFFSVRDRVAAERASARLRSAGFGHIALRGVSYTTSRTYTRYFHPSHRALADRIGAALGGGFGPISAHNGSRLGRGRGTIELWIAG